MKTFWFVAAILMSFFIGRFSANYASTFPASEMKSSSNENVLNKKDDSSDLVQINFKLEAEIDQLKKQLSHQQSFALSKTELSTERETEVKNNLPESEHALADAQKFTELLSSDSNNFYQQINEKFNLESIDSHWATQQQQRIDHWLKNTKELENFAAEDVSCKTTSCKITFPIRSIENSDELTKIISKAAQQSGGIIKNSIIYDHSIAGSLSLYIAR